MSTFHDKKGIVMGVVSDRSIATAIARALHKEGASLGFSYLPDEDGQGRMAERINHTVSCFAPGLVAPCNVDSDAQVEAFFQQVKESFGTIDFLVHSVAFAPTEDLQCATIDASRRGFLRAMDTSVYSLIRVAHAARPLMNPNGSLLTLSYYGGEKVMPGYNLMGVCKAALESAVRYLAFDLGGDGLRVNAISAGPLRTLASSAVHGFKKRLDVNGRTAALGRNITADEVGSAAAFLLSPMASGMTGEVMHVDAGFHIMGMSAPLNT